MFAVVTVFVLGFATLKKQKPEASSGTPAIFPYESQGTLFSPAERSFLGVLEQCVRNEYRVYGKVRLADILKVTTPDRSKWQRAFNAISKKHVDFVLCDPGDTRILAVIELDDKSHTRKDRKKRDAFLEQALAAANVPLLRLSAKSGYSLSEVSQAVASVRQPETVAPN